jgi:hypothetical protein
MTLVERLRRRHECRELHQTTVHHLINPDGPEAADALETAEKALESFAAFDPEEVEGAPDDMSIEQALYEGSQPTVGDLRRARAAREKIRSGR